MANDYRSQQRPHRSTGNDWRDEAGYSRQRNRTDYDDYQGYRSDYDNDYDSYSRRQGYGNQGDSGWHRRSVNEMREEDDYGTGSGRGSANYGTGSYGLGGNAGYMSDSDYDSSRRNHSNRRGYAGNPYRGNEADYGYGAYSSDYGFQGRRHRGFGFNRPDYGRDRDYREQHFSSYTPSGYRNEDRDWWDRAGDEVASWFGDDDAERRRRMDKQQGHRGRGPKGYKRSDDRIREDVNDRLSDDPWVDASDIEVSVNNGEVTLSGHVPERGAKRRTEDLVESVSGVTHVENRLRVTSVREDEFKYPTAATSGGATNTNSRAENGKTRSSGAI